MTEYNENEYLLISGIQHFVFCRRQWALIHIEQQWAENYRTVDGSIMHRNAHDKEFTEKRGNRIITRGMAVSSSELGINGECDVVEFICSENGTEIFGHEGKYSVVPVEYKRGEPKENESDIMQLCAQAMCLEEMLCCEINEGFMFYGENKRRYKVVFSKELRERTKAVIAEMHMLYARKHTPKVKRSKSCNACSLKDLCLPGLMKNKSARKYVTEAMNETEGGISDEEAT